MTGQVKEEVLSRFGELGLRVRAGEIHVDPRLLRAREFSPEPGVLRYLDVDGGWQELAVPARGIAFTWCQVPIVYRLVAAPAAGLTVLYDNGVTETWPQLSLPAALAAEVFGRSGRVREVRADVPERSLLGL
jgi:hypothetical protein